MAPRLSFTVVPQSSRSEGVVVATKNVPRARCGDAGRRAGSARGQGYIVAITPVLQTIMRERGRTAQAIAIELTRRAVRKPRGGVIWTSADAQRLLRRLSGASTPIDRMGKPSVIRRPDGAQRPADRDRYG